MNNYRKPGFLCTSIVGRPGADAFGVRSQQELVRDEVAFAPGLDPHRGLLHTIERINARRELVREDEAKDDRRLLPAG
jgi:hypothetical protein